MAGEEDTTLLPEQPTIEPPDAPVAVEDYGVTAAEESHVQPLAQRLARELPDLLPRARVDGELRPAEEAAVHVRSDRQLGGPLHGPSQRERLELLETQVAALLAISRIQAEALEALTSALQRSPMEEPHEATARISRAARDAHDLLLSLRATTFEE